jgi:nicotinamide-nucleotide amidase
VTEHLRTAAAARTVIGLLAAQGLTAGTAESLTGGLVAAALTAVPGASAVFRGGIVAYAADLKQLLLGVSEELLGRVGTVHPEVAAAMADGARHRLGASTAIATTGVAGPDSVDGHPVGTVHIAVSVVRPDGGPDAGQPVSGRAQILHRELRLAGDRGQIRDATVSAALNLLVIALSEDNQ